MVLLYLRFSTAGEGSQGTQGGHWVHSRLRFEFEEGIESLAWWLGTCSGLALISDTFEPCKAAFVGSQHLKFLGSQADRYLWSPWSHEFKDNGKMFDARGVAVIGERAFDHMLVWWL